MVKLNGKNLLNLIRQFHHPPKRRNNNYVLIFLYPSGYNTSLENKRLSLFVKEKRKFLGMTQEELSLKAGVGLRFIRELERGKSTLQMNKVNQVLNLFGYELGPVKMDRNELINEES